MLPESVNRGPGVSTSYYRRSISSSRHADPIGGGGDEIETPGIVGEERVVGVLGREFSQSGSSVFSVMKLSKQDTMAGGGGYETGMEWDDHTCPQRVFVAGVRK
jgi:hypothetical protein